MDTEELVQKVDTGEEIQRPLQVSGLLGKAAITGSTCGFHWLTNRGCIGGLVGLQLPFSP